MRNNKRAVPQLQSLLSLNLPIGREGGGAEVWAGDLEIGTGSLGTGTSSMRVLAVTRWSLPWNRYVMFQ